MRRILGKVQVVHRYFAAVSIACEKEPGLFLLRPGVEELKLGARDSAIVIINCGRLRAVPVAGVSSRDICEYGLIVQK
jgi:hypothetical protein